MTPTSEIVERLRLFANRAEQSHSERYESDADDFYRDTGYLAPGKSVPLEMGTTDYDDTRAAKWRDWCDVRQAEYVKRLREAADRLVSQGERIKELEARLDADAEAWDKAMRAVNGCDDAGHPLTCNCYPWTREAK